MNIYGEFFYLVHLIILQQNYETGDLIARATNDVDRVVFAAGEGVLTLIDSSIMELHDKFRNAQHSFSLLNNQTQEILTSIRMIRSFGLEENQLKKFNCIVNEAGKKNMQVAKIDARFDPVIYLSVAFSNLLAITAGGYLVWHDIITIGQLTSLMIWPMLALAWINIPSLKKINFTLLPGKTLGVCGPTGSGKSTLLKLIQRQFKITEGEITYGSISLLQLKINYWRRKPNASKSEIEKAAKLADIHKDIICLPEGYQTQVGERGVMLSGGQKQHDALSAVDGNTENNILNNLEKWKKTGRSIIIVAHRLSGLINADEIIVIKKGVIIQKGNHKKLIQEKNWYQSIILANFKTGSTSEVLGPILITVEVINKLRNDVMNSAIKQPIHQFDSQPIGQIISKVTNDTESNALFSTNENIKIRWFFVATVINCLKNEAFEVGVLYAFITYLGRLNEPLISITIQQSILQQAIVAGERIFSLIDSKKQAYGTNKKKLKTGKIFHLKVLSRLSVIQEAEKSQCFKRKYIDGPARPNIKSMPKGLHSILGEEGNTLSVGQKQLLSIARILVKNPKILILDEATANIDSGTEKLIQTTLTTIKNNTTLIVIAHRLSTIVDADIIVVLDKGKVAIIQKYPVTRKYRPQYFKETIGQKHIITSICNAISMNKIHHAWLLSGTRGIGKTTIGRLLAKSLNCQKNITSIPCRKCNICKEIEQGTSLDFIEIDAASRTKIEDMKEILDNIYYAPIKMHMLSRHSFNALLKTLEEPPKHVKFILATTEIEKIPKTIISRCLYFTLNILSEEDIFDHLQFILNNENIDFDKDALKIISEYSKGSMRDALNLLEHAISFKKDAKKMMLLLSKMEKIDIEWENILIEVLLRKLCLVKVD
ncbi:ATP-binding cassette sub-family B member 6, mitochondrial [Aphis craccivora]|uniref:Mitochondrial potassium channel ATP-binding subunit n=1 Tax=Aphis craccivora TaxID=307492 RepID=A0A6G0XWG4_APHCR|nr:ATP-binding cassette sub-family B member 6, mitochondrial [Aphis craccivora]